MGPGEAIAVLSLFIGLPWVVFSGIAKVKAAGGTSRSSGRESSEIRKSELEALIAESVDQATAPLVRRLEVLEAILTDEEEAMDRIDPAVLARVIEPHADTDDRTAVTHRTRA